MLLTFGACVRGSSHENYDLPCQDSRACGRVSFGGEEVVVAAIADGVGSCKKSDEGANAAVMSAVGHICAHFPEAWDDKAIIAILREAFYFALMTVRELADSAGEQEREYSSTLTVAVFDGSRLCYGHAGDDGLVALYTDGEAALLTHRHKGEEYNVVIPLQNPAAWEFAAAERPVAAAVLMTDGILDATVPPQIDDMVFMPFFQPLFLCRPAPGETEAELCEELESTIFGCRGSVSDDITVQALVNTCALVEAPKWDEEEWNRRIKEYADRVAQATGRST